MRDRFVPRSVPRKGKAEESIRPKSLRGIFFQNGVIAFGGRYVMREEPDEFDCSIYMGLKQRGPNLVVTCISVYRIRKVFMFKCHY